MKTKHAIFTIIVFTIVIMVGIALMAIDDGRNNVEVDAWHNPNPLVPIDSVFASIDKTLYSYNTNPDSLTVDEVIAYNIKAKVKEAHYLKIAFQTPGGGATYTGGYLNEWVNKQHADTVYEVTVEVNDCVTHFTLKEFLELINCED